jgi:hypothetical protein
MEATPMSEANDINQDDEEQFVESTLTQAIENQLESGEPAAAKATYNKLTLVGYAHDDIVELMAHVLAYEIDPSATETFRYCKPGRTSRA